MLGLPAFPSSSPHPSRLTSYTLVLSQVLRLGEQSLRHPPAVCVLSCVLTYNHF